eukprot:CAMPEP_0203747908 /NCGR_PEP_ID=MMETSP0098-20131031/2925_1 /ASSEMBLY_ACC=CAM_ASM_000208 /TAXON_ID=96639 /ORGANISM=" , Strain NY0313808BC1" /LENGTH=74 /DNA_ID=CAMNT_0050636485 /DNA_START=883 /DNA_END=1110 /DNA_ORIENTATION=+
MTSQNTRGNLRIVPTKDSFPGWFWVFNSHPSSLELTLHALDDIARSIRPFSNSFSNGINAIAITAAMPISALGA